MAVATSNKDMMRTTYNSLRTIVDIVDMGDIRWFLGMAVSRDHDMRTISLNQGTYIDTVVKRFGMDNSYGVSTPLDPNVILSTKMSPASDEEKKHMKNTPYQPSNVSSVT